MAALGHKQLGIEQIHPAFLGPPRDALPFDTLMESPFLGRRLNDVSPSIMEPFERGHRDIPVTHGRLTQEFQTVFCFFFRPR